MSIFNIGRICVKIAGRDAGKKCVIVEQVDDNLVVIDGQTRRRKVNIKHLEPLQNVVEISASASSDEVAKVFEGLGLEVRKNKSKKVAERPRQQRKVKTKKPKVAKKEAKKEVKVEKKTEVKAEPKKEVSELKAEVKAED